MAIGKMSVGVSVDTNSLNQATNQIKQAMNATGKEVDSAFSNSMKGVGDKALTESKKVVQGMSDVSNQAKKSSSDVSSFANTVGNIATLFGVSKIVDAGKGIITIAGNLQQATVAFTTMLGSAEKAKTMLKDLSDFAMKTPFEIIGIRETAKSLIAYGFAQKEILPTLNALGNVAAGVSKPIEQIALAYGQVRTANQLYGTELRQFTQAGVPLIGQLATQFGKSEAAIKKMVETGQIKFKDVEKAFQSMTGEGGMFFNLMQEQSKTLQGAWSNTKDNVTRLAETFGTLFIPVLTNVVAVLTPMIANITAWIKENPKLAATIGYIVAGLTAFLAVLSAIGLVLPVLTAGATALGISLSGVFGIIGIGIAGLTTVISLMSAFSSANDETKRTLGEVTKELNANKKAQEDLKKQYAAGLIGMVEYNRKMDELKAQERSLSEESKNAAVSLDDVKTGIQTINQSTLNTKQKIDALEALRAKAVGTAEGLQEAINKLNQLGLEEKKKQAETERGLRATSGQGAIAPGGELLAATSDVLLKSSALAEYNKQIDIIDKELNKLGGGAKKTMADVGKASKERALTDIETLAEFNRQQYALKIDDINRSKLSEEKKSEERLKVYRAFFDKQLELEVTHIDEVTEKNKKLTDSEKLLIKDRTEAYKKEFDSIDKAIDESQNNIKDYQKAIQKVADDFKDLKEKAVNEIGDINRSLTQLSSDYSKDQAARYAEVVARMAEISNQNSISASDQQELNRLQSEFTFLVGVTTSAQREQATEYAKLGEAQKNAKKYDEERLALIEKQQIATAVARQELIKDAEGQIIGLQEQIRVDPETQKLQYQNEKQMWIDITDTKNIEYARDLVNQQTKMQAEIQIETDKINQQIELQNQLYAQKTTLEATFSAFVLQQTNIQRSAVQGLISDVNAAISRIQALQSAQARSSKGFMAGGYTGDVGVTQEAGVVHGQEYVISNPMLQQLPGIIPALESVRNGGSFDYSKNINIPQINVKGGMFDFEEAFEKIKFRL